MPPTSRLESSLHSDSRASPSGLAGTNTEIASDFAVNEFSRVRNSPNASSHSHATSVSHYQELDEPPNNWSTPLLAGVVDQTHTATKGAPVRPSTAKGLNTSVQSTRLGNGGVSDYNRLEAVARGRGVQTGRGTGGIRRGRSTRAGRRREEARRFEPMTTRGPVSRRPTTVMEDVIRANGYPSARRDKTPR